MTVTVIELNHDQKRHRSHRREIALLRHTTKVELLSADTIPPEPIQWLWEGWMASGKLHILAGPPGTGKTTVATSLAATISNGGIWPDGSYSPVGNVLIWSGEDDSKDTLVPRLIASGGDLSRVFFVGDVMDHGVKRCFDPAIDMEPLMEAIQQIGGIRLLVIDPIVSAVQGDSHKNAEVRRGLQPLVQFGNEIGCAILGITHFSKGTGGKDPVERISGSIAFGALARIVYVTAELPREDQQGGGRIICRSKSNIGPDQGGFRYDLRQSVMDDHPDVSASTVVWEKPIAGSARELLNLAEEAQGSASIREDMPQDKWLFDYLTLRAQPAMQCMEEALAAGFS